VHRLHFAVIRDELPQRTDAQERFVVPNRPQADIRRLKPGEVQGVGAAGRRLCSGSFEMELEKLDNARVAEVTGHNPDHDAARNASICAC
jgi:hypothetical protein